MPCAPHQQRCRSTLLSTTDASGRVLRREERGCAVPGVPDVTVTFLSRGRAVTLSEERCGGERCNRPRPPEPLPPPGPPRFCPSCSATDGSCGRPPLALRCPRPGDVCLDVTTRLGGEEPGDDRIRGCGQAGPCRGLLGFESGHSLHMVRCCNSTHCGTEAEPPPSGLQCWACEGPAPHGCRPTALPCRGGLTHCMLADTYGPSGEPWLVRGCASELWCETPVGLEGGQRGGPPRCCQGSFCNRLPGDPPSAAAPPQRGIGLGLLLLLLALTVPHA